MDETSPSYELVERLVKDRSVEGREPELWVVSECEVGGVVVEGWVDTQVVGLVRPLPQRAIDTLRHVVQDATVRGVTDKQHLAWR